MSGTLPDHVDYTARQAGEKTAPALTVIVTCKGRLEHLQQTFPALTAQDGMQAVLVDYGCPQQAGHWAARHYAQSPAGANVTVVHAPDIQAGDAFNVAHARNLGAAAARADWLCFTDADIRVDAGFLQAVWPQLQRGRYCQADPVRRQLIGTVIVHRDDFARAGGYDEVIQGWGGEDRDFYARLQLAGVARAVFPAGLLAEIPHSDALRTAHYTEKNAQASQARNALYVQAKLDAMRLLGRALSLEERQALYREVAAQADAPVAQIEITLPPDAGELRAIGGRRIERKLVLRLLPRESAG